MTRKIQFDANNRPVEVLDSGGGQVDSVGAGTAISVTGTLSDPVVNVVIADLISSDTPNTATTGSDSGLLVPPVDPAALISADTPNALSVGTDGGLVAGGPSGTTTVIRTGSDLQVGDSTSVEYAPADAGPWTGWAMTIHPAGGTAQVDVLVAGVSITSGGTSPNVSTGTSDTGSTSGWAGDSISAGQSFEVQVTAVTGIVERIDVYLHP